MNSAKLIIHTFCGTGHLECLAANRPTVVLFQMILIYIMRIQKNILINLKD